MGRHRLDENEKKVNITLSIKKKYVDELRKRKVNISALVEEFIKKFLRM
ncbi:type II toxin-antitoxin system CcdA family antitoxin [Heyndrickxia oleronia]